MKLNSASVTTTEESKVKTNKRGKVFFPGLNELRFFAAFAVIIHHVEQLKSLYGYKNYFTNPFIDIIGGSSVTFFFVLSGFLITYLLLVERRNTSTINVKNFYIRRTLRIWPLYYLLGILSLFILPFFTGLHVPGWQTELANNHLGQIVLYLLFLPNVALVFLGTIPHANQVWSIGVEEQFYLVWPLLVKYAKSVVWAIQQVMIGYLTLKLVLLFAIKIPLINPDLVGTFTKFYDLLSLTRIDCMAIGGIGAYLLFNQHAILSSIYSKFTQYLTYAIAILFVVAGGFRSGFLWHFNEEIFACISCIIIINIATNSQSIIKIKNRYLDYLGRISYGLYMYHCLAISLAFYLVNKFTNYSISEFSGSFWAYVLAISITIIFSIASYHLMEYKFIKQKHKYSQVISGSS